MHRIDNSTSVTTMPIRKPAGSWGFFSQGSETAGQLATIVEADILNAIMMEIANVVTKAGISLNKLDDTQLWQAIQAMLAAKWPFMPVEQGGVGQQGNNKVHIGWMTDGSGLDAQVDAVDLGPIAFIHRPQTWTATQTFATINVTTINGGTFSGSSVYASGAITAGGTVTGGTVNSNGNMNAAGTISGSSFYSSGAMTAAGTVTGGTVNSNGNMTAAAGMYAAGVSSTGNISAAGTYTGGAVSVSGQVRGNQIMSASGIFYVADNPAYYVGRGGDGAWRFVENGNVTFTIDGGGNASAPAGIYATGVVSSGGNTNVGNSLVVQHDIIFANATNPSRCSLFGNGDLGSLILNVSGGGECAIRGYQSAGETQVIANGVIGLRIVNNGDGYFISNVFANAFNPSDTRIKEQSAPYTRGLADVLRMAPKTYKLKRDPDGPLHVSVDAQALLETIPEAVVERDYTQQDGLADQLFIQPDFVNYAMLNAIKELAATVDALTARVTALEAAA